MATELGHIEALFRYPVKSMRGESLESTDLGWHGFAGDRRLAFRRLGATDGFPWVSASSLPELLYFTPIRNEASNALPSHVRTPEGQALSVFSEALDALVSQRLKAPVQLMHLKHGIFDEACVSIIAASTVAELCRLAATSADVRRFRPNVLLRTKLTVAFEEDSWVGKVLRFGEASDAATVTVTQRDIRCSMVNFDPEGGTPSPELLKTCVRQNENNAGVYGAVARIGRLAVGQRVFLLS